VFFVVSAFGRVHAVEIIFEICCCDRKEKALCEKKPSPACYEIERERERKKEREGRCRAFLSER